MKSRESHMTRAATVFLVLVFVSVAALTGLDGLWLLFASQAHVADVSAVPVVTNVRSLIEWLRVVGGIVGMIFGGIGVYIYYRTTVNKATVIALNETTAAYKQRIDAFNGQLTDLVSEQKTLLASLTEKDVQIATLRERTDITSVLALQNELLTIQRTHDVQIIESIKAITDTIHTLSNQNESRYAGLLGHLSESATQNVAQTTINGKALTDLVRLAAELSRRLVRVEGKVDDVQELVAADEPVPPSGMSERRRK